MKVLIAGAGPAGLTTAVELARRGIVSDVIDLRESGSGLSRAVGIMPASLEILRPSGVTGKLLAEGMKFRQVRIYRHSSLALALSLKGSGADDAFILGLAQDRTETHLRDVLSELGGTVRYRTELADLRQDANKVTVEMRDGAKAEYDYVVGADGARSTTRELLNIDFRGHDLPETWSIADVDAEGWPNTNALTICRLSGGDVVVVVPLEPERFRVVSNTEDALATLPLTLNVTNIRRAGAFKIAIRQATQYGVGRVFLVGDAAHCHSPVGGRGMNLGIADGAELARRMVEGGLEGYGEARHKVGKETIAWSEAVRKVMTSRNPITRFLVLAVLQTASFMPALQRQFARKILYG
ncbi:MAG: FAD-dependent monooxygenase [Proteobacteria bacterium]|nr:FAD-dependent monooxygenase [Pseudomonadota bacterium]